MTTTEQEVNKIIYEDAPWLGAIPTNWQFRRGKFFLFNRKEINEGINCENILSLTMKGVVHREELGEGGLVPESYETFQVFYPNDLVFKLIDLENFKTSRVGLVSEKGIMSSAYIRLMAHKKVPLHPKYAYYFYYNLYLQGIYNFLGMGVRSTLNPSDLLEIPVALPPLDTQKRIAAFLDEKTKIIDELIAKKERLIELLKEKRQALITRAVTKGLDPNAKMKPSDVEWLGEIPEGWEIKPFRTLFVEQNIKRNNSSSDQVLSLSYGNIVDRELESNFGLMPTSFDTYQVVYPGWVVFRLTDLQNDHVSLRTGMVNKQGIITSAYLAVEPQLIQSRYAAYLLYSYDICKVFYAMGGGVRQSIGYSELKWLPILMPTIEKQECIADYLDSQVIVIDSISNRIELQIDKLKEYRSSLIYAAVTGKVKI